ncbi:MAG: ABC transporter permease [Planctomycetota bacterium]|nr:ABC transporter permease [Planctomycetota bacterium]MDA1252417.1 ABC transporter permease [Planctomycetota bacterium]
MSGWIRTFQLGVKSLTMHKLRAALAMTGILIGVTAVIWLVALGEGVSAQAQKQIQELGARNIIIKSVKPPEESSGGSSGGNFRVSQYGITRDDLERIDTVKSIVSSVQVREIVKQATFGGRIADIQLVGCTSEYAAMNHLSMDRGEFLSGTHDDERENVCVVSNGVASRLFPYEDPIGRRIQIGQDFYTVIGQTQDRAPSAAIGGSLAGRGYDRDVYIPISTFRSRLGKTIVTRLAGSFAMEQVWVNQVTVTVEDIDQVEAVAGVIEYLFKQYHPNEDYSLTVPKELLRQAETLRAMFNVLLVLIAGISLVVGGIGIMNIMLATVTERTREIGVRRALGARRRDIISQFLAETIVLTGLGGALGVFAGFLCQPAVMGVQWFIKKTMVEMWNSLPLSIQEMTPVIAPWSVIAAFMISVAVGVVFGIYPARRASMMDPIEALRHE